MDGRILKSACGGGYQGRLQHGSIEGPTVHAWAVFVGQFSDFWSAYQKKLQPEIVSGYLVY
jgi:hypothetical protein